MKNKKIKNILLLTLFSVLTFSGQEVFAKTLTGKFTSSDDKALIGNSGLPGTSFMYFETDGKKYDAYCSWYELPSPKGTEITFEEITSIKQENAVGIAYILNTNIIDNDKINETKSRVIKTAALNIYLSKSGEKAGHTEFDRYDASKAETLTDPDWPLSYYIKGYKNIQKANDWEGLMNFFDDCAGSTYVSVMGNPNSVCTINNGRNILYYEKVASLIRGAESASANYKNNIPKIYFENKDEEFTLSQDGKYYTKTYKVVSTTGITELSAEVTGIEKSYVKELKVDKKNNTIYVKIDAAGLVGNANSVKVKAKAKTSYKKAKVYKAIGAKETEVQDIVIAEYGLDYIEVNSEDKIEARTCYKYEMSCDQTACEKTNQKNERKCVSKVVVTESQSCSVDDLANTASGKYTAELIAGKCSLYCTEEASVSYPGNVSPAITLGTNFAWPTSLNDRYPLTTSATLTCKIEMNPSATPADRTACVNAAKKGNYKYENSKSGNVIYDNMAEEITIPLEQKCSSSQTVNDTSVTISNNCYYTLPEGKNVAIDKKTVDFIDKTSVDFSKIYTNYILIKYHDGVLPIEGINWNNKIDFKKKYTLKITELALGNKGQFTNVLNNNDYVCNYKVTTVVPGSCQCPPGTKYSGVDISGNIITNKAKNCADAIEKFCKPDDGPPGDTPIYCKKQDGTYVDITSCINDKTKTQKKCEEEAGCIRKCPSGTNNEGYLFDEDPRYQACIKDGGDDNACMLLVCNDICVTNCEYKCPEDSDYPGKDITTCVYNKMGQGMKLAQVKLAQAIAACEKEECYKGTGGGNIIYRTISLENPFPSKDADDNGTTQAGLEALNNRGLDLNKNTFNQTIKGRYPGTNWNSAVLVYNKILNNRGYRGSAIYQEAEPLYVIELDPKAIKEIREYNKKQVSQSDGYADFKLNCTDGAYCISSFLHNNSIKTSAGKEILTGGTCKNAYNKKTFISCYKTK